MFSGHVRFIDYEYTGYNYQAYDIGNHFNEFAGEWISSPPPATFPAFVEAGNALLYLKLKYVIYRLSLIVTAATHYSQKVLLLNLLPSICRSLTLLTYCAPICDSCFWAISSSVACQQIQRMEGKA